MRYDYANKQNRRRAAALLEALRDRIEDASDATEHFLTMQAATSSPHWRLSNVAGVHVYEVPGGWIADLAFKDLPAGVPTVIGNAIPCASRRDALRSAIGNLSLCAEREKAYLPSFDSRFRWFVFDDVEVPVDPDYLPDVAADLARKGYGAEEAREELAHLRLIISGEGPVTGEGAEAAGLEVRRRLVRACEAAMALGITQFSVADDVLADYAPAAPGMMH